MADVKFYLCTVRVEPGTGKDMLTAVNHEDEPFDLPQLLAAMRATYDAQAASAAPDEGVMLQIIREPVPEVLEQHSYALSYPELALILEQDSEGAYGGAAAQLKPFVAALEEVGAASDDLMEEPH